MKSKDEKFLEHFEGFVKVSNLRNNYSIVPDWPGDYMIVKEDVFMPEFLVKGTGGFFKGKDPNVSIQELEANWVSDTNILYIGKATSLRTRLKQYMKFGQGQNVGHWGGRYIWQLKEASNLLVCWKTEETAKLAKDIETLLIQRFKSEHDGMRPFANLQD